MSMSGVNAWVNPVTSTRTPVITELWAAGTVMVDGYGVAVVLSLMVIGPAIPVVG